MRGGPFRIYYKSVHWNQLVWVILYYLYINNGRRGKRTPGKVQSGTPPPSPLCAPPAEQAARHERVHGGHALVRVETSTGHTPGGKPELRAKQEWCGGDGPGLRDLGTLHAGGAPKQPHSSLLAVKSCVHAFRSVSVAYDAMANCKRRMATRDVPLACGP